MRERGYTLRPVAVRKVEEFLAEPVNPEWSPKQKEILRQEPLFAPKEPLEKIPFDFRIRWVDEAGDHHRNKFIAWEVGETWRSWSKPSRYGDRAVEMMQEKWMNDILGDTQQISFFMGNYRRYPKNYGICGIFSPPKGEANAQRFW